MDEITTLVAVDADHMKELKLVWPTWVRHRPEILNWPLMIICDADRTEEAWRKELEFVQHPRLKLWLWSMDGASQRHKMLSGFVYGAAQVETPWYLKLDTDAVAKEPADWYQSKWFLPDEAGRVPVFVSSPWKYSKPADVVARLDDWADQVPELGCFPRLNLAFEPGARIISHRRIISWCFFGNTSAVREAVRYAPERLPIASHDTFLWYVAARRGDFYRTVFMKRLGWDHISRYRRLKAACEAACQAPRVSTPNA